MFDRIMRDDRERALIWRAVVARNHRKVLTPTCICGQRCPHWTTNVSLRDSLEGHILNLTPEQLREHIVLMEMQR